jgi:hypothetical protein
MSEGNDNVDGLDLQIIYASSARNILVITDEDSYEDDAANLVSLGLNNFRDWECSIGSQGIHIYNDGNVYGSVCRAKCLGNAYHEFEIEQEPVICTKDRCVCTTDIKIEKHIHAKST